MKILVDADACPVVSAVERVAKKHGISVILLCDTNHVLHSEYSEVKMIGAGLWTGSHDSGERCIRNSSEWEMVYG